MDQVEETPVVPPDDSQSDPEPSQTPPPDGEQALAGAFGTPLQLAWGALLFQEDAYAEVRDAASPIRRGLTVLVIVMVLAGVAGAIGQALGVLTSPPLVEVKRIVTQALTQMLWYRQLANQSPEFERSFREFNDIGWQIFPLLFGAPSWPGVPAALCLTPVVGVIAWAIYGVLTQVCARLLGGQANTSQFLGVLALAYAPTLLRVIEVLPGVVALGGLVGWWTLATSYLAVKSTHNLSWSRNLAAVVIPRVALSLLLYGSLIAGGLAASAFASRAGG